MEYEIIMDVSGDIDIEVAEANGVKFIPMEYSLGGSMRTCVTMESNEVLKEFYDGQRNGDMTKTSQISPYKYEEFFKDIMAEGKSSLYLCLSSGLSSTYQSACLAKQTLEEEYPGCLLYPIDSLAATGGMGVLAERAINNRKNGMSLEENYKDLVKATKSIRHWFEVEDLMYLKNGGRISASTAIMGTALNIKPILIINPEGKLMNVSKKRGDKAALKELISHLQEEHEPTEADVIYITHADCVEKAEILRAQIKELYPDSSIRICGLSPIIGAHTGPGMVAVCFMGKMAE